MLHQLGRPLVFLAKWLGGWSRVVLLIATIAVVIGGLVWQTRRQPNVPPGATQVSAEILGDLRQTSFRYPGTIEELRAFYQQGLPKRGWRYCGTRATAGCSNLRTLGDPSDEAVDVYRRADDDANTGSTIEVWPQADPAGQVFVTIYETRQQ